MAPRKTAKDQNISKDNANSAVGSDSMSLDASQSQEVETINVQSIVDQHNQKLRARKKQQTEIIETAHKARVQKWNNDVKAAINKRDQTIRNSYRPKLERLIKLTHQKRELDSKIADRLNQIEEAYLRAAEKVQFALDARIASVTTGS